MGSLKQMNGEGLFCSAVDRELLLDVQKGDRFAVERLITKYENIVHRKANTYFLVGSDRDDVVQEGLIGLYKAICDYDENKRASFRSFAELCITRQIISSIKSATRQKHTPLNAYVSFYKPIQEDESDRILLETLGDDRSTEPLDLIERKEQFHVIRGHLMEALTKLEWEVLYHYLQGLTYEEIAIRIRRHEKAIDNALQRVKRKVCLMIERKELEMAE
jgi:RNA polymerase sporulation-specific sigma factor